MSGQRAILWFRQDLRLHDNEALTEALKNADEILPVYIFDERVFKGRTCWFNFPKTDSFRAKFIIESVENLRKNLRQKGNDLIIRIGKPEEIIFQLARETEASWVFCNRERTTEEVDVQDKLERKLWSIGREMRYSRGKLLYYTADLPFPITHTPDKFIQFRKEVERFVPIRMPLAIPVTITPVKKDIIIGKIPSITDFGHEEKTPDSRAVSSFLGGEDKALERLNYFFWETDSVKNYKQSRNELIGKDYSTKLSPYLAQGCLSPKFLFAELKRYEQLNGADKNTAALFLDLLWRDFFRLMAKKYEAKIFLRCGTSNHPIQTLPNDWATFASWQQGKTTAPFIDANMRELQLTGYMSNRGRQNVASYLIHELNVNWQMGAEYFESVLIDYDVSSNWGNWNFIAGVGSDTRESAEINTRHQAKRYDPKGEYVKIWMPELEKEAI